ncbi:MAG: hypothetical protein H6920_04165 [Sphingomonadaceae bacterium]|nr:hypothetical protein [Altererythrobacter sp.]MCP5390807.1 hypothetical protein [Sphingomonadaceae bacterium]MCP5394203.1 hypothetical protein [Sphingomonadaceae bacterium]
MRTVLIAFVVMGALAAPVAAQQRPAPQVRNVEQVPQYRDDYRGRPEGRFVLRVFDGKLFLLDTESGCMWSRISGNFGTEWYYEGPRGTYGDCEKFLQSARRSAQGAN